MSVGLGIFLSSVVLALVILYSITKDRWSWRRIAKLCALTFVTLVVLAGVVIGGVYLWNRLPATIYSQTEYAGLRLSIGPDEVMYIKGYPPAVLGAADKDGWQDVIKTKDLKKGDMEKGPQTPGSSGRPHVQDYKDWSYEGNYSNRILVTFNAENTAVVVIACQSHHSQQDPHHAGSCPSIAGLTDGDSEQQVIRKLGAPGASRITGVTKFISYPEVGIYLRLEKERVYELGIYDPKHALE